MPELNTEQITTKLKKAFCKTFDLPIKVYQEPYFTDRLELFQPFFETIDKYKLFCSELPVCDTIEQTEQQYLAEYHELQDAMIQDIKANPGYQTFNHADLSVYQVKNKNLPGKAIYKPSNHGRVFVSLDMRQANFQALRYFDPSIFQHKYVWEDYVRLYTDKIHWIKSKHLRQVIMGNCNPGRHTTYEKYLMDQVLTKLFDFGIDPDLIAFFSNDEIVIDITDTKHDPVDLVGHLNYKFMHTGSYMNERPTPPLRIQAFVLYHIDKTNGYYKLFVNSPDTKNRSIKDLDPLELTNIEFKGLSYYEYPFVLRKILKQSPRKTDRVFYHENRLAQFLENIEVDI